MSTDRAKCFFMAFRLAFSAGKGNHAILNRGAGPSCEAGVEGATARNWWNRKELIGVVGSFPSKIVFARTQTKTTRWIENKEEAKEPDLNGLIQQ